MKIRLFIWSVVFFTLKLHAVPTISDLNPNSGPRAGGTAVDIVGQGFSGTTSVTFDGNSAPFVVVNDNLITVTTPVHVPGVAPVQVTTPAGSSSTNSVSQFDYQGNWINYIINNLSFIDALDLTTDNITTLDFSPTNLIDIAITPDGKAAYISAYLDNVLVLDLASNTIIATITVGRTPTSVAITPNGERAYVANYNSASLPNGDNVSVIDIPTNQTIATIPMPTYSFAVGVSPDGSKGYVTNTLEADFSPAQTVTIINLDTNVATGTINVGLQPRDIKFRPNGTRAYVVNNSSHNVSVIDVASDVVIATIAVGQFPNCIAISPDGTRGYVPNGGSSPALSILNLDTNATIQTLSLVPQTSPSSAVISPDGQRLYVSDSSSGVVYVIGTSTNAIIDMFSIPGSTNMAITPDQAPIAQFSIDIGQFGATTFDASDSSSPTGDVALYEWNFGDGHTTSTANPVVAHTYTQVGSFNVTLTVTNTAGTSTTQSFTGQTMSRNGGPTATLAQTILIDFPPTPPTHFTGTVIKNKFATQTEYVHQLTWNASSDTNVIEYQLFRNGKKITTLTNDQGHYVYNDHNRKKGVVDTYTLIAINTLGTASNPLEISVPKK